MTRNCPTCGQSIPMPNPPADANSFPAMTFKTSRPGHTHPNWSTPSSIEAYEDGRQSGIFQARRGQFYRAGGPWVPKATAYGNDTGWDAYCAQCALVNAIWLKGWEDGQKQPIQPQSEVDHQVDFQYHRIGRD